MTAIHTLDCIDPFDWWCILAKIPKQHQPSLKVSKHITARCLYMHHIDTNSTMNKTVKVNDKHVLSTKNKIQPWLCVSWHTPNHANNQFSDCDCHLDRTWTWGGARCGWAFCFLGIVPLALQFNAALYTLNIYFSIYASLIFFYSTVCLMEFQNWTARG